MLSLHTRGPPLSPCSRGERVKVLLGGLCQRYGCLRLSHSTCQSCIHCTERLCSGAGAYRPLSGGGGRGPVRQGCLSSLHSDPGCVEDGCSRIGIWTCGLPRALDGLSGQGPRPLGQEGTGQGPADGEGEVSPNSGRVTCQAKHAPGYVWVVVTGLPVLLRVDL